MCISWSSPRKPDALALSLKQTHGRYTSYWNAAHRSSGHVWQGRFYSCPLDSYHLWVALRYVELNPVRAGLVAEAESWPWSSAAAHFGSGEPDTGLEMEMWEDALVNGDLAGVSGCRRSGIRDRGDSSVYAHGPSTGHARIHLHSGASDTASFSAAERWASGACNGSSNTSNVGIRKIALTRNGHFHKERKRPVCPRFPGLGDLCTDLHNQHRLYGLGARPNFF